MMHLWVQASLSALFVPSCPVIRIGLRTIRLVMSGELLVLDILVVGISSRSSDYRSRRPWYSLILNI